MTFSERLAEAVALRMRQAQLDAQRQQFAANLSQIDTELAKVAGELQAQDRAIEAVLTPKKRGAR